MPTRHGHDHDHEHDHDDHAHAPPPEAPPTDLELEERAISALLIEKGVITEAEIQRQMNFMASRNPALGAKIAAKAWADPAFKNALMTEPRATLQKHFDIGTATELKVFENGPCDHHVVTCTLCLCYPRLVLGPPPA